MGRHVNPEATQTIHYDILLSSVSAETLMQRVTLLKLSS